MRVIKQGKLPETILHTGRCYRCGTEVEFERREGTIQYARNQMDDPVVVVKCPTCGHEISSSLDRNDR